MTKLILLLVTCAVFSSCGNSSSDNSSSDSGSMLPTESESQTSKKESNAITQSMPSVMVIPSDAMLKRMNCLKESDNQGVTSYSRDYAKSFI